MDKHEVIVGNIGTVYSGDCEIEARNAFTFYLDCSMINYGRAAGESVTWFINGEIHKEHFGTIDSED